MLHKLVSYRLNDPFNQYHQVFNDFIDSCTHYRHMAHNILHLRTTFSSVLRCLISHSFDSLFHKGRLNNDVKEIITPFIQALSPLGVMMHMYPASDLDGKVNDRKLSVDMKDCGRDDLDYHGLRSVIYDSDTLSVVLYAPHQNDAFTAFHTHHVTRAAVFACGLYECGISVTVEEDPFPLQSLSAQHLTIISPCDSPTYIHTLSHHIVGWFLPSDFDDPDAINHDIIDKMIDCCRLYSQHRMDYPKINIESFEQMRTSIIH